MTDMPKARAYFMIRIQEYNKLLADLAEARALIDEYRFALAAQVEAGAPEFERPLAKIQEEHRALIEALALLEQMIDCGYYVDIYQWGDYVICKYCAERVLIDAEDDHIEAWHNLTHVPDCSVARARAWLEAHPE